MYVYRRLPRISKTPRDMELSISDESQTSIAVTLATVRHDCSASAVVPLIPQVRGSAQPMPNNIGGTNTAAAAGNIEQESSSDGSWEQVEYLDAVSPANGTTGNNADAVRCFLPRTAFKGVDEQFLLASHLQPGQRVRLCNGAEAEVVSVLHHQRGKFPVCDLATRHGGRFKLSATHRVVIVNEANVKQVHCAGELKAGDKVVIGTESTQPLTKVTHSEERTDLYAITFRPDLPVEAFMLPTHGIQSHGEACTVDALQLMDIYSGISEAELLQAIPLDYSE